MEVLVNFTGNMALDAEAAQFGVSTVSIFSITRSSVFVRYAQFRSAQC
jgi:hypothetical protein